MRGADREEPVLDRLRGVMRVRVFGSEVRGVLALGRDARRRGPPSLGLLLPVLGRRVPFDRPGKGRRPLDLVVARPLAVAEPL